MTFDGPAHVLLCAALYLADEADKLDSYFAGPPPGDMVDHEQLAHLATDVRVFAVKLGVAAIRMTCDPPPTADAGMDVAPAETV